ncbi:MAG: hypothetical protein ACREEE_12495, partial [Dongiaceae bacterium]
QQSAYRIGDTVIVNDHMQQGYSYVVAALAGSDFALDFKPRYSRRKMLEFGVFKSEYCNDCRLELPAGWFARAHRAAQIREHCEPGDIFCRRRQRKAQLQWDYDPFS